jgi:ribosomal protein S18 acetylase RimI-like enzyme
MMAVLPSHRGRGIAQELLKCGVNFADEAGEEMYLESTPLARSLYEKNGFEVVGTFEMPEGYLSDVMVRKARS